MTIQEKYVDKTRINEHIRVKEVRLIDQDGNQLGVVALVDALAKAKEAELDLVEVSPNADPPVCKIIDFGTYHYHQQKRQKKPKKTKMKVITLRPVTDEGDYQVKLRNLMRFLEGGDKVKIVIRFRGREIVHNELGSKVLNRFRDDLEGHAMIDQSPKLEGRQMMMIVSPKRK
jgi:translation initiation factor IF-3